MDWLKVTVQTTSEGTESVTAMLMDVGINEVQIDDVFDLKNFIENNEDKWDYIDEELIKKVPGNASVTFYVPDNERAGNTLSVVKDGIKQLLLVSGIDIGTLELEIDGVSDESWLNEWKKYYKPFAIGEKIVIRPEWEEYENIEDKIVLTINPAHVFGTGLHQTTQLCIQQLEKHTKLGDKILDLGCGSGILSIASLLLGASEALAIDLDPEAIDIAYENAGFNGIDKGRYSVLSGNVITDDGLKSSVADGKYDVVVANIVADVIIAISAFASEKIKKDGIFITSGIIKERLEDVKAALNEAGFNVLEAAIKDEWVCVVATFMNRVR
ncbi:MAG: 50S ribosomal protein L11 methyltransferase [Defluviitaleaceae bacterium]|nr:50S ribosomal protein L11 methyltransferase [Defluviitaleaceae bacterium]